MIHHNKRSLGFLTGLTLLSLFTLQSCRKDITDGDLSSGQKSVVTFTLQNTAEPRAVTDVTVAPNEADNRIENVYVATYSAGELKAFAKAEETGTPHTYKAELDAEGILDLLVVANPSEDLANRIKAPGTKYEDARKLTVNTPPDGATPLVMTSINAPKVYAERGQTIDAGKINLKRLASKILIFNRVNGLVVTKITMKNAASRSRLVEPFPELKVSDLFEKTIELTAAAGVPSSNPLTSFLTYETTSPEDLLFVIEGTFMGKPISPMTATLKHRRVLRNMVYSLVINSERKVGQTIDLENPLLSMIHVSLLSQSWSETVTYTLPSDEEIVFSMPDFTVEGDFEEGSSLYNPERLTLKTYDETSFLLTTTVKNDLVSIKPLDPDFGLSIEEVSTTVVDDTMKQIFRITVPVNKETRTTETSFAVYNAYKPALSYSVTISQPAHPEMVAIPITYFAEYNLNKTGDGFATTHENGGSGYFSYKQATGKEPLSNGKIIEIPGGYRLPTPYEMNIVFPSSQDLKNAGLKGIVYGALKFESDPKPEKTNVSELIEVKGELKRYYADYIWTKSLLEKDASGRYFISYKTYGIRFKKHVGSDPGYADPPLPDGVSPTMASDNSLATAYEYLMTKNPEASSLPLSNPGSDYVLMIRCRLLGEKLADTPVEELTKEEFWKDPKGIYATMVIPYAGYGYGQDGGGTGRSRGFMGRYMSEHDTAFNAGAVYMWEPTPTEMKTRPIFGASQQVPIRLIKK